MNSTAANDSRMVAAYDRGTITSYAHTKEFELLSSGSVDKIDIKCEFSDVNVNVSDSGDSNGMVNATQQAVPVRSQQQQAQQQQQASEVTVIKSSPGGSSNNGTKTGVDIGPRCDSTSLSPPKRAKRKKADYEASHGLLETCVNSFLFHSRNEGQQNQGDGKGQSLGAVSPAAASETVAVAKRGRSQRTTTSTTGAIGSPISGANPGAGSVRGNGKRKSVQPTRFDVDAYCDNEEQLQLQQAIKVSDLCMWWQVRGLRLVASMKLMSVLCEY